jgi:hypothetical protein
VENLDFVPGYSGGAATDSHRLPYYRTPEWVIFNFPFR